MKKGFLTVPAAPKQNASCQDTSSQGAQAARWEVSAEGCTDPEGCLQTSTFPGKIHGTGQSIAF